MPGLASFISPTIPGFLFRPPSVSVPTVQSEKFRGQRRVWIIIYFQKQGSLPVFHAGLALFPLRLLVWPVLDYANTIPSFIFSTRVPERHFLKQCLVGRHCESLEPTITTRFVPRLCASRRQMSFFRWAFDNVDSSGIN